jgi:dTDP-4-amino-4,6-dideoxygalactose transaminase
MRYSFVIPCYGSENTISSVVNEIYGNRVLRLPLYADMTSDEAEMVAESVIEALI